ncbi:PAS domain S-box-containing protein [Desulfatibacillum alkenivorans DSM 16219]|uniref:histidine kinase n=1 Tax=Desulfatibacillum alkenivorans DSM 16219 TaxID=1121393 RepID=A0A1M6PIR1_9BACT|nr:MASE3 domain-containing protein [Desulfatibacillum alkenivorans]SHK07819.1 PAS domain S-box-containing protein [Desulfatibacillum alkenivorans DSM 16219]
MEKSPEKTTQVQTVIIEAALLAMFFALGQWHYLLFHSAVEIFCTVVCWAIFLVGLNTRQHAGGGYFTVLASGYLYVGIFTMLHMMAYKGMNVLQLSGPNIATQLWVSARFVEVLVLVSAPFFIARRINLPTALTAFGALTLALCYSIFFLQVFPVCYVEGQGLTTFKTVSEYIFCLGYLIAGLYLYQSRMDLDLKTLKQILLALGFSILAELSFTLYNDVYGLANAAGHFFKLLSFYLIYRAVVRTAFENPLALTFRDLERKQQELAASEARFRSLFRRMDFGAAVFKFSPDQEKFVLMDINSAGGSIDGVVREQVTGKPVGEVFPHYGKGGLQDLIKQVWRTNETATLGPISHDLQGRTVWRKYTAFKIPSQEVVCLYSDETGAQRAIQARQRRSAAALKLFSLSKHILGQNTVELLLQSVAAAACEFSEAQECGAIYSDSNGNLLTSTASSNGLNPTLKASLDALWEQKDLFSTHLKDGPTILGRDEVDGLTLFPGTNFFQGADCSLLVSALLNREGALSGLVVAVRRGGPPFEQDDREFAGQIASLASLGLQLMEARNRARRRANTLEALLEAVPALVWRTNDPECRVILGNKAANNLLSVSPETNVSPAGRKSSFPGVVDVFDSMGAPYSPEDLPLLRSVYSGKPVMGEEMELRLPDGGSVWIKGNATPLLGRDGKVEGGVSAYVDITDQKRTEVDLRRIQEDLKQAQIVAHVGSWRLNLKTHSLQWSKESYRIFGIPDDEPINYDIFLEAVHPDDRERVTSKWQAALAGDSYDVEHRIVVDGAIKWVREIGGLEQDANGVSNWAFGTVQDITSMKLAHLSLHEKDQHLGLALQAAAGFSFEWNPRTDALKRSPECKVILGLPDSATREDGQEYWDYVVPKDRNLLLKSIKGLSPENPSYTITYGWIKPDNNIVYLKESAYGIFNGAMELERLVGISLDVTPQEIVLDKLAGLTKRFRLLASVAGRLLASEDVQASVEDMCMEVMQHLSCSCFFNYMAHERSHRLHLNAYSGIPAEQAKKQEWLDYGESVSGCVALQGEPFLGENLKASMDPKASALKDYGIQAYCCHPLVVGDQVIGTLAFGARDRAFFSYEDKSIIKTVANQTALAMERILNQNALEAANENLERRVAERTRELESLLRKLKEMSQRVIEVQENERKAVAQEVHDSIGAGLAAVKFSLERVFSNGHAASHRQTAEAIEKSIGMLKSVIDEARRLSRDLWPTILRDLGLVPGLHSLLREYEEVHPQHEVLNQVSKDAENIPAPLHIVIYRVVQEAMNNAASHSKADKIIVNLASTENNGWKLSVEDNGIGMDTDDVLSDKMQSKSLGLASIRERVSLSGGELFIESAPGRGTRIVAQWSGFAA